MENDRQKMKLKVVIDFEWYSEFKRTEEVEIDIPFIPRVGEWFLADCFLSEKDKHQYDYGGYGLFYVRNIVHDIDRKKNIQRIIIRVDDTENEFYHQEFPNT